MFKKSKIVVSSCTGLRGSYKPVSHSESSCLPRQTRAKRKLLAQPLFQQYGAYPTVIRCYSRYQHEALPWPEADGANATPTPYQIFNQRKGSRYSKRRFYELVKLYHPDRHNIDDPLDELPFEVKLERYRLVVAANELLSDPAKRAAYDCYGAGWNGQQEAVSQRTWAERGQSRGCEGPFQNATWEDWEKWHKRDEKVKQKPVFISNSAFVAFVVMFSALGGVLQATRADKVSMTLSERRDTIHSETSKDLMRRRNESSSVSNRDARVTSFLKERDPYGCGATDPQVEGYRKFTPTADICSNGKIGRCSKDLYDPKDIPKDRV